MSEAIMLVPLMPKLKVTQLGTSIDIKDLEMLMRLVPEEFVGISTETIRRMRVHARDITVKRETETLTELVAEIGNYLVTSENGKRFITTDRAIRHGVVTSVPRELFQPIEAQVFTDSQARRADQEAQLAHAEWIRQGE